jgi:hypothetical protein
MGVHESRRVSLRQRTRKDESRDPAPEDRSLSAPKGHGELHDKPPRTRGRHPAGPPSPEGALRPEDPAQNNPTHSASFALPPSGAAAPASDRRSWVAAGRQARGSGATVIPYSASLALPPSGAVRTKGPSSVSATECSQCDDHVPSVVMTVQSSSRTSVFGVPRETSARSPGRSRGPAWGPCRGGGRRSSAGAGPCASRCRCRGRRSPR